jgi:uncharacterized protein YoxC
MNDLIHADIFFFVTTIAVVVVGLVFTIALIYLIQILHRIRDVVGQVREETVLFREDVHQLRDSVRSEGFKIKNLLTFFNHFTKSRKSKKN